MGTRQVEVTIPFQVKKDKREAPGEITLPPEGVPNKPLGFIILHGAARGKHNAHATATMTAYATTLAKAGFTVVRYTHRSNVEGRGRMVGVVLDFLAGRPETAHVTGWIGAGFSMGCRAMCAAAAPVAPEGGAKDDTHGFGSDLRGLCLFAYPLYEESKGEVRDKPLTTLKLPILMVKGTHDGMSPDNVWNPVMERMQTPNKTIELVEGVSAQVLAILPLWAAARPCPTRGGWELPPQHSPLNALRRGGTGWRSLAT